MQPQIVRPRLSEQGQVAGGTAPAKQNYPVAAYKAPDIFRGFFARRIGLCLRLVRLSAPVLGSGAGKARRRAFSASSNSLSTVSRRVTSAASPLRPRAASRKSRAICSRALWRGSGSARVLQSFTEVFLRRKREFSAVRRMFEKFQAGAETRVEQEPDERSTRFLMLRIFTGSGRRGCVFHRREGLAEKQIQPALKRICCDGAYVPPLCMLAQQHDMRGGRPGRDSWRPGSAKQERIASVSQQKVETLPRV